MKLLKVIKNIALYCTCCTGHRYSGRWAGIECDVYPNSMSAPFFKELKARRTNWIAHIYYIMNSEQKRKNFEEKKQKFLTIPDPGVNTTE